MAFRFRRREKVKSGLRRIATEQLDKTIAELNHRDLDDDTKVHQVRKRFKKLRGLLRLVRPGLGDQYGELNVWFRDRARRLSRIRDAETLVNTAEKLLEEAANVDQRTRLSEMRDKLAERRDTLAAQQQGLASDLEELRGELHDARARVPDWQVRGDGDKALFAGFHKTYRRARQTMKTALADPTDENWHEWRKRMKYHWYHTRLLENCWKPVMATRAAELSRIADLLGDDHDLAILNGFISEHRDFFQAPADNELDEIANLVERRRKRLRADATALGRRLCVEKPGDLRRRTVAYWQIWRA